MRMEEQREWLAETSRLVNCLGQDLIQAASLIVHSLSNCLIPPFLATACLILPIIATENPVEEKKENTFITEEN